MGIEASILLSTQNFNAGIVGTLSFGKFGDPVISKSELAVCKRRLHLTRTMIISGASLMVAGGITALTVPITPDGGPEDYVEEFNN